MASPEQQRIVSETITTTKIELERIKKGLEEKKERHKEEREEKKEEKREERSEKSGRNRQEE